MWSTLLKHVAYIDETSWQQYILQNCSIHLFVFTIQSCWTDFHEIWYWQVTRKIVELFWSLFRLDSCSNHCAWNLHVQMNVCIPVLHMCSSFHTLCLWTNSLRIRATEREWAFHKKNESLNAVIMKQQDTTFTLMTNEIAITAIFQGLGYTLGHWGTSGLICCGRKSFVSSPKCPDQIWGPTRHPIQWVLGVKQITSYGTRIKCP